MARFNYSTTIAIDTERSVIHFYSMNGNDVSSIAHTIKSYPGGQLDDVFFQKFKDAVRDYTRQMPSESVRKITVILPDNAVLTDVVKIPTMKGSGQTKKALDVTLESLYRNYSDLKISSYIADQNKQYTTFAITAVQERIVAAIYAACSENKLLVDTLTFASGALIGGALQFNSKLKNASYLFLDIKDIYSRFVFVANGKPVGYYTLPFGREILEEQSVVSEDMLFDHSYAELTIRNARERARSQKLTVMTLGEDTDNLLTEDPDDEDDEFMTGDFLHEASATADDEEETAAGLDSQSEQKLFARKIPRELPQFMCRETPTTKEGFAYENFRIFVKWALTLIEGNPDLIALDKPKFVCVNLPRSLISVLGKVNEEAGENGIIFTRLPSQIEAPSVVGNLELYGGLFPEQIAPTSTF